MSISCGIVGLPNVGKSTLFNALTNSAALTANYPFATIEPNTAIVNIPDTKLTKLAEIYHSKKVVPATIRFVDIAGLIAGASHGEGLGNQFLDNIRSTAIIIEVVRGFEDPDIIRSSSEGNPEKDISVITTELVLSDLATTERRLPYLLKEAKANPKLLPLASKLQDIYDTLNQNQPLATKYKVEELADFQDLRFLTAKPIIYVFNIDESSLTNDQHSQMSKLVSPAPALFINAKLEHELTALGESDEADSLRSLYNISRSGLDTLITAAYDYLGLQSFYTAGEKETRAWTVRKGSSASSAAGVIHSDFERGFIAAEIVNYNDLIALGSISACRSAGKLRTEGKNYLMQPDDVVEFRFNV